MKLLDILIKKLAGYDVKNSVKELNDSLKNNQEQIENLIRQRDSLQRIIDNKQNQIVSSKQEIEELRSQIEANNINEKQLRKALKDKQQENDELSINLNTQNDYVKKLINSINFKDNEINGLNEKVKGLEARNKSKQGVIMNHVKRINMLSKNLEEKKLQNEQLNIVNNNFRLKIDENNVLVKENVELSSKIEKIEFEKSSLEETIQQLKNRLNSLEEELTKSSLVNANEIRELESQIQRNEESINEKNRKIEVVEIEKQEGLKRFEDVCNELEKIRTKNNFLTERNQELELLNSNIQKDYAVLVSKYSTLQEKMDSITNLEEKKEDKDGEKQTNDAEVINGLNEVVTGTNYVKERHNPLITVGIKGENKKEGLELKKTIVHIEKNKKTKKSKENEAIYLSEGCIVDFPVIVNDSNKSTHRTIEYVYDENEKKVNADEFFDRSAEEISQVSRKLSEAEHSGNSYWTCGLCRHRVKVAHRKYDNKESLFFIHATRDHYCPWLLKSIKSKDKAVNEEQLLDYEELGVVETLEGRKPKSRELKEKIYTLLISSKSKDMGINDVRMDEVIRSTVSYMRWRRPDISFIYKGKKFVIELQKRSHALDTIVDKDIFFRLNQIQIIWVFGSDSDSSYDYMRELNYKNTMFDNHRNVFVFDKDAQERSDIEQTLILKCNWLTEDDTWHFRIDNSGVNGKLIKIDELILDDEYCKPYFYDANIDYFVNHPEARSAYLNSKMTSDELKKSIEEKWTRDPSYENAQVEMRKQGIGATLYCVRDLWGFRFEKTVIIPPIFTKEPKMLSNGFYLVSKGSDFGIVNSYGEKVFSWEGLIKCDDLNFDAENKRLLFVFNGKWGVANLSGDILINALYDAIQSWTANAYRVRLDGKWGVCNIDNNLLVNCKYDKIEELINSRAIAVRKHPNNLWKTVSGYIDEDGNELFSAKIEQSNKYSFIQVFELWGVVDDNDVISIPCKYEDILTWTDKFFRVKENGKWGVINVENNVFLLQAKYDYIGELRGGVAKVKFAGVESSIDTNGNEVAQETILLQGGLKKTKIAGKWGIVNANGEILVKHNYDEIGSFRSRMIGVINNKIIKLDVNYLYPIYLEGKYINSIGKFDLFNIAGVKCALPNVFVKQLGKNIGQLCDSNGMCNQLSFSNLIFKDKRYLLRILKSEYLTKKLSHADNKEDFALGEEFVVKIISFKSYAKNGIKRRTKAMVEFEDGRKSMVPRRFFNTKHYIDDYDRGDAISIKKVGFDEELDQTIWQLLEK